jgi:hypothetical protein
VGEVHNKILVELATVLCSQLHFGSKLTWGHAAGCNLVGDYSLPCHERDTAICVETIAGGALAMLQCITRGYLEIPPPDCSHKVLKGGHISGNSSTQKQTGTRLRACAADTGSRGAGCLQIRASVQQRHP